MAQIRQHMMKKKRSNGWMAALVAEQSILAKSWVKSSFAIGVRVLLPFIGLFDGDLATLNKWFRNLQWPKDAILATPYDRLEVAKPP